MPVKFKSLPGKCFVDGAKEAVAISLLQIVSNVFFISRHKKLLVLREKQKIICSQTAKMLLQQGAFAAFEPGLGKKMIPMSLFKVTMPELGED